MRILVTGGAGFIGSHVVEAYVGAGHRVTVLDDCSRGKPAQVHPAARLVRMDLRAPELPDLFAAGRFDCVSHHAAQIDVRRSVADPAADAAVNIGGSLALLEAVRAHRVPRVIFASTGGAIYGPQEYFPADESHPTRPVSPYGVAKLSVEHYLEYYRQVHGLRYAVLRYANVCGPRQDPEGEAGVVAIFCARLLRGEPLTIYGDGAQTRDYVYVEDVARANLLALEWLRDAADWLREGRPVFNVGTGRETSVLRLAGLLREVADRDCAIQHAPARPGEQARSAISPARAARVLGWRPAVALPEALLRTLRWCRAGAETPAGAARA
ncbi:MAG: NAD-dependent epimerase/dehydratase family protein [Candidatus Methylomirabilales bacterium]